MLTGKGASSNLQNELPCQRSGERAALRAGLRVRAGVRVRVRVGVGVGAASASDTVCAASPCAASHRRLRRHLDGPLAATTASATRDCVAFPSARAPPPPSAAPPPRCADGGNLPRNGRIPHLFGKWKRGFVDHLDRSRACVRRLGGASSGGSTATTGNRAKSL